MKSAIATARANRPRARSVPRQHRLHSREQVQLLIRRESARIERVQGHLSLVVFRLGDPSRRSIGRLTRLLLADVRVTDDVGLFDDGCVCVILPHTPKDGARIFADRIHLAARRRAVPVTTSVLTYPSEQLPELDGGPDGNGHSGYGGHNGNGHNGNGHNGNGHNGNGHNGHSREAGAALPGLATREVNELEALFLQGFATEMSRDGREGDDRLERMLVRPMPGWKRAMDVAGAIVGLIVFAPVLLLTAAAVKLISPGPVLFTQLRAGLGGRPFKIYKFRTMVVGAAAQQEQLRLFNEQDGPAFKIENDPRVTRIGRILRTTSLDELPQLWNVLMGDMSLVGPRPLPCDESAECEQWQRRRLDVTPGITCIWQVRGRSSVSFPEWCRMDMAYIRGRRLLGDVKIILLTIPAVLLRRGAR